MRADQPAGSLRLVRSSSSSCPPRVLMLHGLGTTWRVWQRDGDPLAAEWSVSDPPMECDGRRTDPEVWAADLPWRGDDAGWATYPDSTRFIADAVAAVPGGTDIVVAHSFAATMLLDLATRPVRDQVLDGVAKLVLVSPFYKPSADEFGWDTMAMYMNGFVHIMAEGIKVNAIGRCIEGEILMAMAERVRDRVGPYGWMRFFETYLRTPEMKVEELDRPCLIISGESDVAASPADSQALAERIPRATLTSIRHCGHFPMIEAPIEFGCALESFHFASAGRPMQHDGRLS